MGPGCLGGHDSDWWNVPCICEVERILSFLKVAKTPFEMRTTLFPSSVSGSSCSESERTSTTSTNRLSPALCQQLAYRHRHGTELTSVVAGGEHDGRKWLEDALVDGLAGRLARDPQLEVAPATQITTTMRHAERQGKR